MKRFTLAVILATAALPAVAADVNTNTGLCFVYLVHQKRPDAEAVLYKAPDPLKAGKAGHDFQAMLTGYAAVGDDASRARLMGTAKAACKAVGVKAAP